MSELRGSATVRSVLVVEDDERLLGMFGDYARDCGWTTWEARDGLEALWVVQHHHPRLVLLDLHTPPVDGFETIHHIQQFDASIRIVVITGDPSDDTRQRVEALGLELLLKPFPLDALKDLFADRPT